MNYLIKKAEMKKKRRMKFLKSLNNDTTINHEIYNNIQTVLEEFQIETNNPMKYYEHNIISNIEIFC